jgi:hypothetical protein
VHGRDWSRGNVIFGWYSVRISVGTPALLAGAFSDFTQSLQENAGILPQLGYGPPPSKIFSSSSFMYHPPFRRSERRQVAKYIKITLRFLVSFILVGKVIPVTGRGGL